MEVSKLEGAMLDYWVARAEGMSPSQESQMRYMPSTDWADGGKIIEREGIAVTRGDATTVWFAGWQASSDAGDENLDGFRRVAAECWHSGSTPLIAAMRAFVDSKFGPKVA
ncbi:phage protein NinX family protein [Variovorax paradoxus]|uniref:DUF2591 domain-containing protein n=1 Tax=Variovorax paradoxus TaxID=34073 RepID=A0A679J906_VARPD|nr:hypothetical protein VVAX_04313 [Variovorax paradoxus]